MPMIMRAWNLNRREREIVELLLHGHCNKEIAKTLGLSLNTIKVYLKLLMGKLGVGTRSGIISILLSGRLRSTY
ncbi:MAG: helix-turn-helix transcriptional regulator [Candidatus Brocadia sp.]|jgi:DNA-binding NarL/FixJ family response regulator